MAKIEDDDEFLFSDEEDDIPAKSAVEPKSEQNPSGLQTEPKKDEPLSKSGQIAIPKPDSKSWRVLLVDDDEEIHFITKLALKDFVFDGKKLEFTSAFSGQEAKDIFTSQSEFALVLLDVVMEDDDAGLRVARFIRDELKNFSTRIILRTGQPGQAPENKIIIEYDINDYKTKTELTAQKLVSTIVTALRSYRDITAKILTQHELSLKTQQLQEERDIFISGPVSIVKWESVDGDFVVRYASVNVIEMFGYSADDFMSGRVTFRDLVYKDDFSRLEGEIKEYENTPMLNSQHEYRVVTKDGKILWINHFLKAIRNKDGEVTYYYGYLMDITQKKEIERIFFEGATEGIVVLDQESSMERANSAMCKIFDVDKGSVEGHSIFDFLDEENKEVVRHIIATLDRQESMHRFEIDVKDSAGGTVPVLFNPTLLKDLSGNHLGVLAFVIDLSEQKKMEEDLKRAMRAEKRFIATMSHEIRTPLTSIIGFAELLRDTILADTQKELVQNISVSSQHLLSLINSILDVSKVEAGQLELTQEEVNLDEALSECGIIVSTRIKDGVKLIIDVPEFENSYYGDQLRIKQLFLNLLGNASKFTDKGHIKLFVSRHEERSDGGAFFEVCVEDTGMGIPKDKQENLFQPFKQAHSSKYGGTGLGLYLAKSFAKLMGGDIILESEEGKGTRFYVSILLNKGTPKELKFDLNGKKLLYIEDDKLVVQELAEKFKKIRGDVVFVEPSKSTPEIIQIANDMKPDIIVVDMDFLKESSGNILSAIKEIVPSVIAIGIRSGENVLSFKEFNDYLSQPFSFYKLVSMIDTLLKTGVSGSKNIPNTLKVLLAEDVAINQELARKLFKKFFDLDIETADDGVDAVAKARAKKYDVIFMDMNMPNMDGTQATREIRGFDKDIPIIALTANAYAEDIERAYKSGMNNYCTKPFVKEKIEKALLQVLGAVPLEVMDEKKSEEQSVSEVERDVKEIAYQGMLEDFGEEDVKALVEQVSIQAKKMLEEAQTHLDAKDVQNLGRTYHSIKGMLLSIKLDVEAEIAKELELACRNNESLDGMEARKNRLFSALKKL